MFPPPSSCPLFSSPSHHDKIIHRSAQAWPRREKRRGERDPAPFSHQGKSGMGWRLEISSLSHRGSNNNFSRCDAAFRAQQMLLPQYGRTKGLLFYDILGIFILHLLAASKARKNTHCTSEFRQAMQEGNCSGRK